MTDEYVIRVTCDEDGTDETITLTPEQFEGVRLLAERVNRRIAAKLVERWDRGE